MNVCPAPLVSTDVDCTDLDGFMLNVERLMASELVALSTHEVVGAALFLWCRAWKQRPAASLPDDERVLAAFARMPVGRFRKLRGEIMRGFVKCTDGRLYHVVLAGEATSAYGRKQAYRKKRETDAERLQRWRDSRHETAPETPDETRFETQSEARFVQEGQGQGQGQGHKKEESPIVPLADEPAGADAPSDDTTPPKTRRGTRLPRDWMPAEGDVEFAMRHGYREDQVDELRDEFRDYWAGIPGQRGVNLDWSGVWRNRIRAKAGGGGAQTLRPGGAGDRRGPASFAEAAMRVAARRAD